MLNGNQTLRQKNLLNIMERKPQHIGETFAFPSDPVDWGSTWSIYSSELGQPFEGRRASVSISEYKCEVSLELLSPIEEPSITISSVFLLADIRMIGYVKVHIYIDPTCIIKTRNNKMIELNPHILRAIRHTNLASPVQKSRIIDIVCDWHLIQEVACQFEMN
jgi:hypothetical protein